ncbi:MAG: hypothetical protein SPJ13_06590 [Bacteroidales bacterium]|nr:hypothetical protein [Bacteroidales bacterium]
MIYNKELLCAFGLLLACGRTAASPIASHALSCRLACFTGEAARESEVSDVNSALKI